MGSLEYMRDINPVVTMPYCSLSANLVTHNKDTRTASVMLNKYFRVSTPTQKP